MEPSGALPKTTRVPWHRLRAWIDGQVDYEREHDCAAPLSQAELEAISLLVSFGEEPEVGDRDYVSLLLNETQSRRLSPPVFTHGEPVLVPIDGHLQPKWSCVCFMAGCGAFPRDQHGVETGLQPPVFQNAKRYAAKCALQYLRQQTVLEGAVAAAPPPTPSPGPARGDPTRTPAAGTSPRTQPLSAVPSRPESGSSNPDGDEGSVFRHVADLATSLNMSGPRYEVVPDGEIPGFFRAWPVFAHADMVPPGLGVVINVLGKRQAKLQVAEKVLLWLEAEKRKRRNTFESLFRK